MHDAAKEVFTSKMKNHLILYRLPSHNLSLLPKNRFSHEAHGMEIVWHVKLIQALVIPHNVTYAPFT